MAFVYAFRSGASNRFKIGHTGQELEARRRELLTGSPDELTTFDFIETDIDESRLGESFLHSRLGSKLRIEGGREWFDLDPDETLGAFRDARDYLATYVPLQTEVARLADAQSEDRQVIPGERDLELHRRLRNVREALDTLQIEKEHIENQLKLTMGTAEVLVGVATWRSVESPRLDQERLRADHPDLCAEYVIKTRSRRFYPV